MKAEAETRQIELLLSGSVVALVSVGVILGILTHDPHWLNRAGATVAALAAGAILLQVRTEMRIEDDRRKLEERADPISSTDATSPIAALESRLAAKRVEHMQSGLKASRLRLASYVVSCAIVGELLHGFGDLLMCHVLGICPVHIAS